MKKFMVFLCIFSGLLGCASTAPSYNQNQFKTDNYQKNVINAIEYADNFVDFDQVQLPKANLDSADFSVLLNADIAYNQGDYEHAGNGYYSLANKYQDPRLIYKAIICLEHTSKNNEQEAKLSKLLRQLIKVAPNSNVSRLFAIKIALLDNNLPLAKTNLKLVIKADPTKTRAVFLFLSTVLSNGLSSNNSAQLVTFAKYVQSKYSSYPEAWLLGVVAYSVGNQQTDLLNTLDIIAKKYSDWEVPVFWSAGILTKEENLPLLLNMVNHEIVKFHQPSVYLQNLYVAVLMRTNHLNDAYNYIQSQLKLNPQNANLLIDVALVNYKRGEMGLISQNLEQALAQDVNLDGSVQLALASVYDVAKNYESATNYYMAAMTLNASLAPAARVGILRAYLAQNKDVMAEEFIESVAKATQLNKRDSLLLKLSLYTSLGYYQPAYQLVHNVIRNYSQDKQLVYFYASLSGMTGKDKEAVIWYQKYIKLNPTDASGYNDLGFILADKTTRYKEAYKYAKQAYKLAPTNAAVLDTLGWANFKLKQYPDAEKYLLQAYQANADRDTALHLQQVYLAQNKQEAAQQLAIPAVDYQQQLLKQNMLDQAMLILMYYQFGMDMIHD